MGNLNKRLMRLFGFSILASIALVFVGPGRVADNDGEKLSAIRTRMQRFVDNKEIAGAVTLVGRHNKVLSVEAVGSRNLEKGLPMRPDTLFRIASMTKPVTALAIMMLVEEGKVALDAPVEKYLPEFRGQRLIVSRSGDILTLRRPTRPIRVRDLLTHTSGMAPIPPGLAELYAQRNRTLAEGVLAFSQQPLEFEPGSRWAYSNTGIDTLGRILEVESGQPYEEFLKQRIFEPLGMVDTCFYPTPEQLQRAAVTYERKMGSLRPVNGGVIGPPRGAKYPIPAGGLYSTAGDLARLYQMMLNTGMAGDRRLVPEKSIQQMTEVQTGDLKTGFTPGNAWGLGWCVVRHPEGVTEMLSPCSYGHGGAFGTQAWIDPHQDLFLVLLIQRSDLPNSDASTMRRDLQRLSFGALKKEAASSR
jgi:CubicO group peptidase (beta-lactamase class C family)